MVKRISHQWGMTMVGLVAVAFAMLGLCVPQEAMAATRIKTVTYFAGQYDGNATLANSDTNLVYPAFNVNLPETGAVVRSAYTEHMFQFHGAAAASITGILLTADNWATNQTGAATTVNSGEGQVLMVRDDVTNRFSGYVPGTNLSFTVGYRANDGAASADLQGANAKLYVTYEYDDTSATQLNTVIYPLKSTTAGDQGTKRAQLAASGTAPFSYNVQVAENTPTNIHQWFDVYADVMAASTTDLTFTANIGSTASATQYFEEALTGNGGTYRWLVDGATTANAVNTIFGTFARNTAQTFNYVAGATNPVNIIGGEAYYTYTFNNSASSTWTKTSRFSVGEISSQVDISKYSNTFKVILPEAGVSVKDAWFRIHTTTSATAAETLNVTTKVGAGAESAAVAYAVAQPSQQLSDMVVIHSIPAADLASITNGTDIVVSTQWGTAAGATSAELLVTYQYTGASLAYTNTASIFGGQQIVAAATSFAYATLGTFFPEASGKFMSAAFQECTAANRAGTALSTHNCNIGGTGSISSTTENDTEIHTISFYHDVTSQITTSNATYTANYANSGTATLGGALHYTYCWDSDPTTLTTTAPVSSATVGGQTYTVQTQVTGELSPSSLTGMAVTIVGTTGGTCDVTGAAMTWNGASSRWEYSWNIDACGQPADGGITIDVTGLDPDCVATVNAAQITNVTINNVDPDPPVVSITQPISATMVAHVSNYLIQTTVTGEGTPSAGSATVTIAGSTACNVTNAAMSWNGTSGKFEYTWSVAACGVSAPEFNITIDSSFRDPDNLKYTNAPQNIQIAINNGDKFHVVACGTCHWTPPSDSPTDTRNVPTGAVTGSHYRHYSSQNLACTDCHINNGAAGNPFPLGLGHRSGVINFQAIINSTAGSSYSKGTSFDQVSNPTLGACVNTYCHSNGTSVSTGSIVTNTSPTWGGNTVCGTCHTTPPSYTSGTPKANSHAKHSTNCSYCHNSTTSNGGASITGPTNHANKAYTVVPNAGQFVSYTFNAAGGTCNTVCCHGNTSPQWGGASPGCTGCHNASVCSPTATTLDAAVTTRRPIVPEFSLTWNHNRSDTGAVTNADCGVCHMEGSASTGITASPYHGNGRIELRDSDTGTTIKGVTFSGTPGSYTSTGTDAAPVRFSRDLSSTTIEADTAAIQVNHCLKCHDANGATNAAALVTGGTALKPFNFTITGHVTPYDTNGNGNVVNVAASFATTNASYHPVSGKANNSYSDIDRMVAPWNQYTKTAATTTSWGDLMTCWDCHAASGASGVQTSTITAHGGAVTLRSPAYAGGTTASTNFCLNCHSNAYTTSGQHGAGSALVSASTNMNATTMQNCIYCHGYSAATNGTTTTNMTSRPLRGENVHGFNDKDAVTAGVQTWTSGANAHRPYAFIRNTLVYWAPASVPAGEAVSASRCSGSAGSCGNGMGTYTVGGAY